MTQKSVLREHLETIVNVAVVLLSVFLLILTVFLFNVVIVDDNFLSGLVSAEATILGFFGLAVVRLLGCRPRSHHLGGVGNEENMQTSNTYILRSIWSNCSCKCL